MIRRYRLRFVILTILLVCVTIAFRFSLNSDKKVGFWTQRTITPFRQKSSTNIQTEEVLLYPNANLYIIKESSKTPCYDYNACNDSTVPKYFYESKYDNHIDARYYRIRFSKSQANTLILGLIKAWSEFTRQNEIISWISHGTLLSWYWNKKLFPWDNDVDFQITYYDLVQLNKKFNQTMVSNRYLLDINPNFVYRQNQGQNVIDARFIDTKNGLYIDITAVSSNSSNLESSSICCKSPHCYTHQQLFPLRDTILEGFAVYGPNDYESILEKEYGVNATTKVEFNGYKFNGEEWVSKYSNGKDSKFQHL